MCILETKIGQATLVELRSIPSQSVCGQRYLWTVLAKRRGNLKQSWVVRGWVLLTEKGFRAFGITTNFRDTCLQFWGELGVERKTIPDKRKVPLAYLKLPTRKLMTVKVNGF